MTKSNSELPWFHTVSEKSLLTSISIVLLGVPSLLLWGDAIKPEWIAEVIGVALAVFMLGLVFVCGFSVRES